MITPFVDLKSQYISLRSEITARMEAVLNHGAFIMGPEVGELESALAEFCGAKHAIAVSSGTDALLIALMAHGIGPGSKVFCPSFTYTATAEVIILLGAQPVFVDVDPRTFNIDLEDLGQRVRADQRTSAPRAVIAVDLFGQPANYDGLRQLAEHEDLALIADAAQSFGATMSGQNVGALAPITATSFFPAKPLGCYGDGGAIFTDDDRLAQAMRSMRAHGQGEEKYEIVRVGLNARMDTLQAAILLAKLPKFRTEITARQKLASYYDSRLGAYAEVPRRVTGTTSAWAQYTIMVANRDQVATSLTRLGVPTAVYYPKPMHLQPAYQRFGHGTGSLPVSEALCGRVLSLPMHPYIDDATAEQVCEAVLQAIEACSASRKAEMEASLS